MQEKINMQFKYFDVHSHLNLSPLFEEKEEAVKKLQEQGIGTITVGTDLETSIRAIDLAEKYPHILWATIGQHPNDNKDEEFNYESMLALARNQKVVAIGECGLDFYRIKSTEEDSIEKEVERQKNLFRQHIRLANDVNKPLMIHARPHVNSMDAYTQVINILEEENFMGKVNFHFFVGDMEVSKRIIGNGWTVSFDGPITFTDDYNDVIKEIPIHNIMAETDAPFAAPIPYRGQTNRPEYIEFIYKKIAEIKEISEEEVRKTLLKNVKRVFGIEVDI